MVAAVDGLENGKGTGKMTTANQIVERAKDFGIEASVWEKGGKLRIYAKTDRRDMAVYLELDGATSDVNGAAYKVFCNAHQHPNWIKKQVAEYRKEFLPLFHAFVVETYRDSDLSSFGPDITKMIQDARDFERHRAEEIAEAA